MVRVLVPLDGSELSASILPYARRFAGPDGELILVRDASRPVHDDIDQSPECQAVERSMSYLEHVAGGLRAEGSRVRTETFVMGSAARAIDEAVGVFSADAVACATHARGGIDALIHPSVAWQALTHSHVPVLLRRQLDGRVATPPRAPSPLKILVPLDGSAMAEEALPVALRLAQRWKGRLVVARVVPAPVPPLWPYATPPAIHLYRQSLSEAEAYIRSVVSGTDHETYGAVLSGRVVPAIVDATHDYSISYIVMASHGRSGLRKAMLGSIAHGILQRAEVPLVVVPGRRPVRLPRPAFARSLAAATG